MRWTKELLETAVSESLCISDVCRYLGIKPSSGNYRTFYRNAKKHGLDTSHFTLKGRKMGDHDRQSLDNEVLFIENCQYPFKTVRERIKRDNLIEYKCEDCGNTGEWLGKKLSLQIDHKNGISDDNRLENLRFLCPNCHAQTSTYGAKNKK